MQPQAAYVLSVEAPGETPTIAGVSFDAGALMRRASFLLSDHAGRDLASERPLTWSVDHDCPNAAWCAPWGVDTTDYVCYRVEWVEML